MQQGQAAHKALFGEDIEEEANSHFQRIYMSEIEIGEVVDMLSRLKFKNNNNSKNISFSTTQKKYYPMRIRWSCCAG